MKQFATVFTSVNKNYLRIHNSYGFCQKCQRISLINNALTLIKSIKDLSVSGTRREIHKNLTAVSVVHQGLMQNEVNVSESECEWMWVQNEVKWEAECDLLCSHKNGKIPCEIKLIKQLTNLNPLTPSLRYRATQCHTVEKWFFCFRLE